MSIVESDGQPFWSHNASKTGKSTKCPWVKAVGYCPFTSPTHGHFVLSPVSLASRDQDGARRTQRSHGKIRDSEQSSSIRAIGRSPVRSWATLWELLSHPETMEAIQTVPWYFTTIHNSTRPHYYIASKTKEFNKALLKEEVKKLERIYNEFLILWNKHARFNTWKAVREKCGLDAL